MLIWNGSPRRSKSARAGRRADRQPGRRPPQRLNIMAPVVHPGRFLKREMDARKLSANRLSLDIGVPSGRITDILNFRRAITADTAVRLGCYSAIARSSGSTCKGSTTSAWSNGRRAPRLRGASGRRMRLEAGRGTKRLYCFLPTAVDFSFLIASRIGPNGPYLCCFSLNLSA